MRKFTLTQEQVQALCERVPVVTELLNELEKAMVELEIERPIARLKGGCAKAALQILGVALPGVAPKHQIETSDLDGWSNFTELDDIVYSYGVNQILNPSARAFESQCNGVASAYMGIDNATAKCALFIKPGLLEVWVSDCFSWDLTPIAYPWWEKVWTVEAHDKGCIRSNKKEKLEPNLFLCMQRCREEKGLSRERWKEVWNIVKEFAKWANNQNHPIFDARSLFYHRRPHDQLAALYHWYWYDDVKTAVSQTCVLDMIWEAERNVTWDERHWDRQFRFGDMDRHKVRSIAFAERYGMPLPVELWGIKLKEWEIEFALAKGASESWLNQVMGLEMDYTADKYELEANHWFPNEGY